MIGPDGSLFQHRLAFEQGQFVARVHGTAAGVADRIETIEAQIISWHFGDGEGLAQGDTVALAAESRQGSPKISTQDQNETEVDEILAGLPPANAQVGEPVADTAGGIHAEEQEQGAAEPDPPGRREMLPAQGGEPVPQGHAVHGAEQLRSERDQQGAAKTQ